MASLLTTVGTRIDFSTKQVCLFGRASHCDVIVNDPASSRIHARLRIASELHVTIEDLGSHNGTYVNDKRLTQSLRLEDHSRIRIGSVTYLLSFVDAGEDLSTCASSNVELEGTVSLTGVGPYVVGDGIAPTSKWTESEFAGQIGPFSVPEVLRFVLASTSNGSLRFAFESSEGQIEIRNGELWDAKTDDGLEGETALIALTAMTTGLFWLVPDPDPVKRTIFAPPPLPYAANAANLRSSIES